MTGVFVVFEGIDGSGKTTLVREVAAQLTVAGADPIVTQEPWHPMLSKLLREHPWHSQWARLELYAADRAEHVTRVIRPALDAGRLVLCDRFIASTIAYQSETAWLDLPAWYQQERIQTVRGLVGELPYDEAIAALWNHPEPMIDLVASRAALEVEPDVTVLLDVPVDVAQARLRARGRPLDDYEGAAFQQRVARRYQAMLVENQARWMVLDGEQAPADNADAVVRRLGIMREQRGLVP
jgi:dTMP kinase